MPKRTRENSEDRPPTLRNVPDEQVLERRRLSDGTWLFRVADGKGAGDFIVRAVNTVGRELTPKHAHFAIDVYGKLCSNETLAESLLVSVDRLFAGAGAETILTEMGQGLVAELDVQPGFSTEYILHSLELIFAQENVNWDRDMVDKPLPSIRRSLLSRKVLTVDESTRGSGLAIALLRQIVRHRVHPVEAMTELGLRI